MEKEKYNISILIVNHIIQEMGINMGKKKNDSLEEVLNKYIDLKMKLDLIDEEINRRKREEKKYENSFNKDIVCFTRENFIKKIRVLELTKLSEVKQLLENKMKEYEEKFTFSDEIKKEAEKYEIDKLRMKYIIDKYGSMTAFLNKSPHELMEFERNIFSRNLGIRDLSCKVQNPNIAKCYLDFMYVICNLKSEDITYGYFFSDIIDESLRLHVPCDNVKRNLKIIQKIYGLTDGNVRSLEEIGRKFNLNREEVRQIVSKSVRYIINSPEIFRYLIIGVPKETIKKLANEKYMTYRSPRTITSQQMKILRLFYGLNDGKRKELQEIGEELNLSEDTVRHDLIEGLR